MNPLMAAKAYEAIQGGAMPASPTAAPAQSGFADLLSNVMGDMTQTSKAAETQMTAMVQGQGSLIDVVTAVSSAEASLETVMAVRDQAAQGDVYRVLTGARRGRRAPLLAWMSACTSMGPSLARRRGKRGGATRGRGNMGGVDKEGH